MAKHCNRCDQDYADDLPACPHCAAAKKTQPAYQHPQPGTESHSSDSAIDLGKPPVTPPSSSDADQALPASPSGSSVEWVASEGKPPAEPVQIESPSDILLAQEATAPPSSKPAGTPSDSAVDLGASPVEIVEEAAPPASDIFAAELASDSSRMELVGEGSESGSDSDSEPRADAGPGSGVDVEEAALDALAEDEQSSAVDLGATAPPSSEVIASAGAEEASVMGSSGVDLEGLPVPTVPSSASGSGSGSDSGRHDASESSVDLGSHREVPLPGLSESGASAPGESIRAGSVSDEAAEEEPAVSDAEVDQLLAEVDEDATAEGVSAAAAEEEAVRNRDREEAEEASAPARSRLDRPRSRAPALVGTTLLGFFLGAGGLIGARMAGVDVPASMGIGGQSKPNTAVSTTPQPQMQQMQQAAPTFATRLGHVRNGDFDEAGKAGIEQIDESKSEELAARGSYRLGAYLQKSGLKVNPQDEDLKKAMGDLQKAAEAKNPDALYDLGLIHELANQLPQARAEYTKGATQFKDDPLQKRRFESALDRVELKEANPAAGALLFPQSDRAEVLALLVIGLQQAPPAAAAQAQAGTEEAGFDFWKAAKLARAHKYAEAVQTIDAARKLHDSRRFTRLRKSQNPLSDPTEDIFLRCCDELKAYWQLQDRLRGGGYLTDKNTAPQALDAALKDAKGGGAAAAKQLADAKESMNKLAAEKKTADDKVAELNAKLKKATDDSATFTTKLKQAEDAVKARDAQVKAAKDSEEKLRTATEALQGSMKKIADELTSARLIDGDGKADIAEAVRQTIAIAAMKDPRGEIRKLRIEAERSAAALRNRWRPQQMMPLWLMLLEQNRDQIDLAGQAVLDVGRVKGDPSSTRAQRGQADIVLGLSLRNAGNFAEAKTALEAGRMAVDRGGWLVLADSALREVSDPAAYAASRAESLYARGRLDAALTVLEQSMRELPAKEQARLRARRSLIELDAARSRHRGLLPPTEPLLAAARRDAEEAAKEDIAEGHYAMGRIAEELGRWDAAAASYRKALKAHPALDADGSRYRIALARVLVQPRTARSAPATQTRRQGDKETRRYGEVAFSLSDSLLVSLSPCLLVLQLPTEPPEIAEAEKLADEILRAPANAVPYNVRAQALAIKGRWSLALQVYIDGLRPLLPRDQAEGLVYLILNHPCLKRGDGPRVPNPLEADKHFAAGVNFYFEDNFADAEKELRLAIENDSQDARYFYFLGLSHLALNRRLDALADFDEGAILERLGRPSSPAVSAALERIQGPTRRILNEVRERPEK